MDPYKKGLCCLSTSSQNESSQTHYFLCQNMSLSRIVLGMHSFRCSEALMGGLHGVEFTRIGYTGGKMAHPSLRKIGDHTEVVEVNYDKNIIGLSNILQVFFDNHDYSSYHSKRYASSIFYTTEEQRDESLFYMNHMLEGEVFTTLSPLTSYHDAEHMYHKYYLQNTPTLMLQLLYEYNWDWKTWFSEFNILPFVTKINAALSGIFPMDYVEQILDSINVPDNIKSECRIRCSHTRPHCLLL